MKKRVLMKMIKMDKGLFKDKDNLKSKLIIQPIYFNSRPQIKFSISIYKLYISISNMLTTAFLLILVIFTYSVIGMSILDDV